MSRRHAPWLRAERVAQNEGTGEPGVVEEPGKSMQDQTSASNDFHFGENWKNVVARRAPAYVSL